MQIEILTDRIVSVYAISWSMHISSSGRCRKEAIDSDRATQRAAHRSSSRVAGKNLINYSRSICQSSTTTTTTQTAFHACVQVSKPPSSAHWRGKSETLLIWNATARRSDRQRTSSDFHAVLAGIYQNPANLHYYAMLCDRGRLPDGLDLTCDWTEFVSRWTPCLLTQCACSRISECMTVSRMLSDGIDRLLPTE